MFENKNVVRTLIIVAIAVIIGVASIYFWGSNNVVEQVAEDVINQELGTDIHLTPNK